MDLIQNAHDRHHSEVRMDLTAPAPQMRPADDRETGKHLAGHLLIPGAVETEHGLMVPVTAPTVLVISVHFLEEDVHDGDFPRDDTRIESYEVEDVHEAARVIEREGLSFAATGTDWAANPDGSTIVNYATGARVETTAHLYGFTPDEVAVIAERVGY